MANYDGTSTVAGVAPSGNKYQLVVPSKNGSYDGDMVTMQYKTLTIASGVTLTTDQPCRGLFFYVQGNCTIAGTLSMKERGPAANPTSNGGSDSATVHSSGIQLGMRTASGTSTLAAPTFAGCGTPAVTLVANQPAISGNGTIFTCATPATTNNGQAPSGYINNTHNSPTLNANIGPTGLTTTNGAGGGGAGGGWFGDQTQLNAFGGNGNAGSGGCGTPWGGGPGGGGCNGGGSNPREPNQGVDYGGAGGVGRSGHTARGGGGQGNPHGTNTTANGYPAGSSEIDPNEDGVGGAIWLIVGGDLTITGTVTVNGSKGWNISTGGSGWCCAGGGSGGGNLRIAYKGTLNDSGSRLCAGGLGGIISGTGGYSSNSGPGGAGTSVIAQVL